MKAVPSGAADRALRAEITSDATPEALWAVLSDVRRMPELSPTLTRVFLGGAGSHADEREVGMAKSVASLNQAVEAH